MTLSADARSLLADVQYTGRVEWQVIHSRMHPALAELIAAGLVVEREHWVCLVRRGAK